MCVGGDQHPRLLSLIFPITIIDIESQTPMGQQSRLVALAEDGSLIISLENITSDGRSSLPLVDTSWPISRASATLL